MIGGDHLLRRDDRMKQRCVDRAEHGDASGVLQQAAGPGDGFERRLLIAGVAAVALPAADRQHEVDAGLVRHARELRLSAQVPDQRSGTLVTARPEEQLAPNSPIFSALPPVTRLRCGNDEFAFRTIIPQACRKPPGPMTGWQRP